MAKKKGKKVAAGSGSGSARWSAYNAMMAEARWYEKNAPKTPSTPSWGGGFVDDDLPF